MSGLAKAFVVINLILAIFFLGSVSTLFTVQEGWKSQAEDTGTKLSELEEKAKKAISDRDGTITQLRNAQDGLTADVNNLESQKTLLESQIQEQGVRIASLDKDKSTAQTRINLLEGQIQDKDRQIGSKDDEIADLARRVSTAEEERKAAVAAKNRAVLDRQELVKALEVANVELASVSSQLVEAETTLAVARENGVDFTNIVGVPKIDAVVAAVQDGIVVLSVGRDDGVQVGYEFDVYHGDDYIGKVRVENVLDDMAGASILYTNDNRTIQTGHKASTRLAG